MEHKLEHLLRLRLVVDKRLPLARRARVARDRVVALQADLPSKGTLDLALVPPRPREARPAQLRLEEELRVPELGGGVERQAGLGRVDVVRGRDGVRGEQPHGQDRVELALRRVREAVEDLVGRVERLGDEPVGRGLRRVLAADEGGELGRARAVRGTDGASELDAALGDQYWVVYCFASGTYKSATEMLWRATSGFWSSMISSRPMLGWKFVSISGNIAIEPSAPPPLHKYPGQ